MSYQNIIEDYLLTQEELQGRIDKWIAGGATREKGNQVFQDNLARYPQHVTEPIYAADQSYIQTLLEYVDTTYGSFENYALQRLEIDSNLIEKLRNNLLT